MRINTYIPLSEFISYNRYVRSSIETLYFTHTHIQTIKAFRLSVSHNGDLGFGSSSLPRLRPETTTFGGGRMICMVALRRHFSGFQPSDRMWYAATMTKNAAGYMGISTIDVRIRTFLPQYRRPQIQLYWKAGWILSNHWKLQVRRRRLVHSMPLEIDH